MNEDDFTDKAAQYDQIQDGFDRCIELVKGYRARLLDEGFSPEAAEQMCVHLHGRLWHPKTGGTP